MIIPTWWRWWSWCDRASEYDGIQMFICWYIHYSMYIFYISIHSTVHHNLNLRIYLPISYRFPLLSLSLNCQSLCITLLCFARLFFMICLCHNILSLYFFPFLPFSCSSFLIRDDAMVEDDDTIHFSLFFCEGWLYNLIAPYTYDAHHNLWDINSLSLLLTYVRL